MKNKKYTNDVVLKENFLEKEIFVEYVIKLVIIYIYIYIYICLVLL